MSYVYQYIKHQVWKYDVVLQYVYISGHHAERSKAMGFCFFNNAAIAAVHARHKYEEVEKVAVIDFDVHHGNGTQEG